MNDAALAKILPNGWETAIATQGPAKDANLRMIFIDRMAIARGDGKPATPATSRLVYLAIPVKETSTGNAGQMIIHGLTDNKADLPGWSGVYQHATDHRAHVAHDIRRGRRDHGIRRWEFVAATGERMEVHVEYEARTGEPRWR